MPGERLEVDAADDRARPRQTIWHGAGEIERLVGNKHRIEIAVDHAHQGRIVLLAVARIGAWLETLASDDPCAEFLRRMGECRRHRRIGGRGTFEDQQVAPFARDDELHEAVHQLCAARIDVDELRRARFAAQRVVRFRDVEKECIAPAHRRGERLEGFRRRIDQKKMDAAVERRAHRRRNLGRRFRRDAIEDEIRLEDARERRRLVDCDFGAGERVFARLEHDPLIGADRFVARIVGDLDEGDFYLLSRRRGGVLRRSGGGRRGEQRKRKRPPAQASHRRRSRKGCGRPGSRFSPCGSWCR